MLISIVDWSLSLRSKPGTNVGKDNTYCPKVIGPKGGKKKIYDMMYHDGTLPSNYPVPAIDYYNSPNPDHFIIGYMMEIGIDKEIQIRLRSI